MSDLNGDLFAALAAASEERKSGALRVLRGEAVAVEPGSEGRERRRDFSGPHLLKMGQAAEFLGVSRPTLWRMIQAGRLEKVDLLRNSFRIRREYLEGIVEGDGEKLKR